MKPFQFFGFTILLAISGFSLNVSADEAGFSYKNSRQVPVNIDLNLPAGQTALLSFYSKGENGLRLLENDFTDSRGVYAGEMQLPIHLNEVDVYIRSGDRQDLMTLPVTNGAINYFEQWVKKVRDTTFVEKNEKGQTVNRTNALASVGSAAMDNE